MTPQTQSILRKVALLVLGLAVLFFVGKFLGAKIPALLARVESFGTLAPLLFGASYILGVIAFAPGSLLTLSGGALFGLLEGTLVVFVAATLGASAAFLIARYVARRRIEALIAGDPRFAAVDRAIGKQGLKIVFLLRLSPVFPFNLLNYALGLTQVRFRDYFLASIGMLPGTFLYVYYGQLIGDVALLASGTKPERDLAGNLLLGLGLVATLLVTIFVTRIARRALEEATRETD